MSAAAALAAAARPIPFDGIPDHVRGLLDRLHAASSAQESALAQDGFKGAAFDDVMRDKFIALHEAKPGSSTVSAAPSTPRRSSRPAPRTASAPSTSRSP